MLRFVMLLIVIAMLAGCMPKTKVPVNTLFYRNTENAKTDCLVVLLPGRGDRVGDFEREGFISEARKAGLKADIMATDLHIGYYYNKTVMLRLQDDVIVPAREKGYKNIWLVGISMGAMGMIYHEKKYPDEVKGIVFIAPFLGEDDILDEVQHEGGVLAWKPKTSSGQDYEQDLWSWIQKYARSEASPEVYLAYGLNDRFRRASVLLSAVLPPDHVITLKGRHLWSTWRGLWREVLARKILCNGN